MPNIVEITDLSAPELDVYARLTQARVLCAQFIHDLLIAGLTTANAVKVASCIFC